MTWRDLLVNTVRIRLLRNILLLSLAIVVVVPVYERLWVYPRFATLLVQAVQGEAVRAAKHLAFMLLPLDGPLTKETLPRNFPDEVGEAIVDFRIVKMKVFSPLGEVLYSTDPDDIGTKSQNDYFYEDVIAGKVFSKMTTNESLANDPAQVVEHLVEIYVPIMRSGMLIGVFEIYYDVSRDKAALDALLSRSSAMLIAAGIAMFALVVVVLLKATRDLTVRAVVEKELRESEEKFRGITSSALDAIIMIDNQGLISYWNKAAERIFQYEAQEVHGRKIHEVLAPEKSRDAYLRGFRELRSAGPGEYLGRSMELVGVRRDGREFPVELSVAPLKRNSGWHGIVILRDIAERKAAEQRMKLSARVMEHALEGIAVTDAEGNIEMVNQAYCELTGYRMEELVGQNPRMLRSGRHDAQFYEAMWKSITERDGWQGEIWNRRKDGSIYAEWVRISTIRDTQGKITNYVGISSDVTQRKLSEERLQRLAYHDVLTGLPNRILFNDRLDQSILEAKRREWRLAVLFLDLDGFKEVNDSFGHEVGDLLLQQVAVRVLSMLREEDTVARLGGDEFVVLVRGCPSPDEAARVGRKLVDAIRDPFFLDGHRCVLSASIGISLFPQHGKDVETLVRRADAAMYRAKQGGGNRCELYEE